LEAKQAVEYYRYFSGQSVYESTGDREGSTKGHQRSNRE
jgi:hypothetical protein